MLELDKILRIDSPLERAALAGKETYDRMRQVFSLISSSSFTSNSEEVEFFKNTLPAIFSQYYYWSKVLDLEVRKKGRGLEMIRSLLMAEWDDMNRFYGANRSFLKYYFEGLTFFDERIFRREGVGFWPFDDFTPSFDAPIPKASELIGAHIAFEKYEIYMAAEEYALENRRTGVGGQTEIELLLSDAEIVELVAPIHELKLIKINGKTPSQAQLLDFIDKLFHRKIKENFSTIDNKNRARKKGATPFLERLLAAAVQRNDRLDK